MLDSLNFITGVKRIKIILASGSMYRKTLLQRLQIDFEVLSPDIDESCRADESARQLALRLAREKASCIAEKNSGCIVIGSDQTVECNDHLIDKPGNLDAACRQLASMSGQNVIFHTGLCVLNNETAITESRCVDTHITFRELSEDEIRRYVMTDEPYDCAGSIKSEELGISLFARLQTSDPTALIGLPLIALSDILRKQRIELP